MPVPDALIIDATALEQDLEFLAQFSTPGPGVTRLAWSEELRRANDWFTHRAASLGLEIEADPAGNLFAKWASGSGPPLVVGSHLDSVPNGGRFDGVLGVVCAFHAVAALMTARFEPARPIWLVSWCDEEGPRFGTGMFGSRWFAGMPVGDVGERTDREGVTLRAAMAAFDRDFDAVTAPRELPVLDCYLELHIEQGPQLEQSGLDIGVVTGLVGLMSFHATFHGRANHAGTTPMDRRKDALCAAARAVLGIQEAALERRMVGTVGATQAFPGAPNVIPGRAEAIVEMRAADHGLWTQIPDIVASVLNEAAAAEGVTVRCCERHRLEPARFSPEMVELLTRAAKTEGATAVAMSGGAGHDGMSLTRLAPVGMIFIPSVDGISHSPDEHSTIEACHTGARVLARALALRASR